MIIPSDSARPENHTAVLQQPQEGVRTTEGVRIPLASKYGFGHAADQALGARGGCSFFGVAARGSTKRPEEQRPPAGH
jgi:hypothetical protein